MNFKNMKLFLLIFLIFCLSACGLKLPSSDITILSVKTAKTVDEKLMPVDITNTFPTGTSRVFCWFTWMNAKKNIVLIAQWNFVTDDIHILDSSFTIPRKAGSGSVSISMPQDKALPSGLYNVNLIYDKRILKSLNFVIK